MAVTYNATTGTWSTNIGPNAGLPYFSEAAALKAEGYTGDPAPMSGMDPGGEFWGTGFLGAATQGAPINTLTYDSAGNPLPLDTSTLTANGPSDIPSDIPSGTPSDFDDAYAAFGNFAAGRPSWLAQEEFRRPQETWNAFMSTQAPFWQRRAPLEDLGARLRGRYLLAAPYMAEQPGTPVSFAEYLRGYPGAATAGGAPGYYASQAQLADRARAAAASASMDPGAYLSQFTPETDEWNRAAWMAAQFNPLDNESQAMQNQLRVANMMALQRGQGQNPMTGMMAAAIRAAMARVQQQRLNQGAAQGSFLNWYMGQTQPGT